MLIGKWRAGDLSEDFDIIWPLWLEGKIGSDAYNELDRLGATVTITTNTDRNTWGYIVRFDAKFPDPTDELIYTLKYPHLD